MTRDAEVLVRISRPKPHWALLFAVLTASMLISERSTSAQSATPTFRSSVAVVPITATVRDSRNRAVTTLGRDDFEVLEGGVRRSIVQFSADADAPVSIAFLFDTSGSMGLASNLEKGREVVAQLLFGMNATQDEAALYTFHRTLREEVPFTSDLHHVQRTLLAVKPWGLTSVYDAVAETARRVTDRASVRRAVVLISDGLDTSSSLTPAEVAALASAIDVPIYVVAVVSPLDHPSYAPDDEPAKVAGGLRDLADMTGGDVVYVSALNAAAGMQSLLTSMRQQYFLAIESSSAPGWYPLEVRTTKKRLSVRSRRAYQAASIAPSAPE